MKGMPLPFDLDLIARNRYFFCESGLLSSAELLQRNCLYNGNGGFREPTSVLDSVRTPSRPTSSSTLSSSHGGGDGSSVCGCRAASTDTVGVAALSDANPTSKWRHDLTTATSSNAGIPNSGLLPIPSIEAAAGGGNPEKFPMEDWESVLPESAAAVFPSQEQSILRWIMGDVEDGNLNKALEIGSGDEFRAAEFDFSGGYGGENQGFVGDHPVSGFMPAVPVFSRSGGEKISFSPNFVSSNPRFPQGFLQPSEIISFHHHETPFDSPAEVKPPVSSSFQNPSFFFPLPCTEPPEQTPFLPPPSKRQNFGGLSEVGLHLAGQMFKGSAMDAGQQGLYIGREEPLSLQPQLQFLPLQRPIGQPEMFSLQKNQQATADLLFKAAELLQTGNPLLAHGILARLNHQLSPTSIPFQRVAFYCKEALLLLLHCTTVDTPSPAASSPFDLIFRIGAYKSFSEISPIVQFSNFTCNQAILEASEGFESIHIVDFDIGFGGQWASFMQALVLRTGGPPRLKITAMIMTSPPSHDHLELALSRGNLIQFASEINISLDFEAISDDSLTSGSWLPPLENKSAVAVNLPAGYQFSTPLVLKFVKDLSPKIVVSVDRACDRGDLSFASHVIHALDSYTTLLESLDAVNADMDAVQRIERFVLQPGIKGFVLGRFRYLEKSQHWRSAFLSAGFSLVAFSNFAESQAECIVKRCPVGGFRVEKRQSGLVLCWQGKELVSSSAWRC